VFFHVVLEEGLDGLDAEEGRLLTAWVCMISRGHLLDLETKALGPLVDSLKSLGTAETWIISVCCLTDFLAMLAIFLPADRVYGATYLVRCVVYRMHW
jgi:hypothetical protein